MEDFINHHKREIFPEPTSEKIPSVTIVQISSHCSESSGAGPGHLGWFIFTVSLIEFRITSKTVAHSSGCVCEDVSREGTIHSGRGWHLAMDWRPWWSTGEQKDRGLPPMPCPARKWTGFFHHTLLFHTLPAQTCGSKGPEVEPSELWAKIESPSVIAGTGRCK